MITVSKILAPVDFSSGSGASVEYAAVLAKALHAVVTLLHVGQSPDIMSSIVPGADSVVDAETDRAHAQKWLEDLRAEAQKQGDVEMRVIVAQGTPAEEILLFGASGRFDMIVMGTHGRTGFRHVVMGSVAEAVVRRSLCPVLTVRLRQR